MTVRQAGLGLAVRYPVLQTGGVLIVKVIANVRTASVTSKNVYFLDLLPLPYC